MYIRTNLAISEGAPITPWQNWGSRIENNSSARSEISALYAKVPRGQLTFDAEGIEQPGSIYHSRLPHVPTASSGVTIGRGFDLGAQYPGVIRDFLTRSGFDRSFIEAAAAASRLRGEEAKEYLETSASLGEISPRQQWNLFNLTYEAMAQDVRRISDKPDTVQKYGSVNWQAVSPEMVDLIIDLRYRGDYTTETRRRIQTYLVRNDIAGLSRVMEDRDYWVGIQRVPAARFDARRSFLREFAETMPAGPAY